MKKIEPVDYSKVSFFSYEGKSYVFNFEKMKDICLISSDDEHREHEITYQYDTNENSELTVSNKVDREIRTCGSEQNDMIIYDAIKIFLAQVISSSDEETMSLPTTLAINTLLYWGLIIEI